MVTMLPARLVVVATCALGVGARKLWATEPADAGNIIMTAYPLGNGKLGGESVNNAAQSEGKYLIWYI
jgi:alpha-L-fucosidase 2